MTRLDAAVRDSAGPAGQPHRVAGVRLGPRLYMALAAAAVLVIAAASVLPGVRSRLATEQPPAAARDVVAAPERMREAAGIDPALISVSGQHFERSKLVLLGIATRDPQEGGGDWADERQLASSLLDDTRLYRMAAEERGMTSLAGVMRDLELVLLQTSMTEDTSTESLEQLQRLIRRRDLLTKMDVMYAGGGS
jgi:hypothetical protein